MEAKWTVAYRLRRANRFLRIDGVSLFWDEATELAMEVSEALGNRYEVYYVPTAEYDAYRADEDAFNILVPSGRRVKIKEGGVLPEGVVAPTTAAPKPGVTMIDAGVKRTSNDPTVEIVLPARFAEFIAGTNLIQNPKTDGDHYTDEVNKAWTTAGVRRGQTVLTLPADPRGENVLNWLYEYAYIIGFGAGDFDRGEKDAALTVRNRISTAKYEIYKIGQR